ncbi:glycosyltransferase [Streptomyces chartreusis]|uniref:UDP-N-acetylglucosamine--N-acetylmuramyl- (pentapeptide) pyrophosphoryl-undecaprenol N-acetylglucosamine transferase n=1 Tax=Streptomyces chartreusis TaxID=1969 RepID=UPI002F910272|nr:hypothetical protein OG938_44845 [Streptomyces chartreusis]
MAARVCLSEPSRSKPPRWLARKTIVTVLPLRHDFADGNPDRLRQQLGIEPGAEVLLIFCGSSGSDRINHAVRSQLDQLRTRFAVIHVCGKGKLDPALHGLPGYRQAEYLHTDITDALWLADLVIGRAGATTLAELEALGKRAVLIPLPASVSRGDQLVNAEAYARRQKGQCRVIQDDEALTGGASLTSACLHLAGAHTGLSRPDPAVIHQAASRIADETLSVARPRRRRRR